MIFNFYKQKCQY